MHCAKANVQNVVYRADAWELYLKSQLFMCVFMHFIPCVSCSVGLTLTVSAPIVPAGSQSAPPAHPGIAAVSWSGYEIHPTRNVPQHTDTHTHSSSSYPLPLSDHVSYVKLLLCHLY